MPLPIAALAGAALSAVNGIVQADADKPSSSGSGNYSPGGISVGSKVVGSGSATTSVPSPAVPTFQPSYPAASGSAASPSLASILDGPLVPILIGLGLLAAVLAIFLPSRGGASRRKK